MELALVNKPAYFNLSGNAQVFELFIVPYFERAQELGLRLNVNIEIETVRLSGVFVEAKQFTLWPSVEGKFQFDVASIVKAYLKQYIPAPTLTTAVVCDTHIVAYKVKATLVDDVKIIDSITESYHLCMLGGLPSEEFVPGRFLEDFVQQKKFLRYHTSNDPGYTNQPAFLFFVMESGGVDYTPHFKLLMDDGSEITHSLQPIRVIDSLQVICVPIGLEALNITDLYPSYQKPVWYEVWITDPLGIYCDPLRFYIDHRAFYHTKDLLYANSLGGVDTVRLRGAIESEIELTQTKSEMVRFNQVFGSIIPHQLNNYYSSERELFKGDTGFLSKAQITRLRDIFLNNHVYEVDGSRLIAVEISGKTTKIYTNRDSLFALQLEYRYGFDNTHWSAERILAQANTCPPLAYGYAYRRNAQTIEIIYALPPGYEVADFTFDPDDPAADHYQFRGPGGKVIIEKPYVDPGGLDIERYIWGRVLCNPNAIPIDAGAWLQITYLEKLDNRLIVGNDTFEVPQGLAGALELPGSVLDNDIEETGAAITAAVVSGAATEKGGSISITADGVVTYTPPSSAFVGTDTYVYTVNATGGGTATGTIYLKVGNPETGSVVFVKMKTENITESIRFNIIIPIRVTKGDVYLYFYKDFSATQPLDTRNLGLVINVRKRVRTVEDGVESVVDTTLVINANRAKTLVYSGVLKEEWQKLIDRQIYTEFTVLSGTGYQVI